MKPILNCTLHFAHCTLFKNIIYISTLILLFLLISCSKKEQTPTRARPQGGRSETALVEEVKRRDLNEYVRLTGVLEGKNDINFVSEVTGQIVAIYKGLGDNVQKGTTIGKIDNSDYEIQVMQAQAAVIAAEASYIAAETSFNVNSELYQNKKISELEYQNSRSAFKNAEATQKGAIATLETRKRTLQNTNFTSPIYGQIVDMPIKVGQTITVGQKIAGIVDLRTLLVKTGIGENSIKSITKGLSARISYKNNQIMATGKVTGVGYKPLPNTATYPIEVEISNADNQFYPGMIVNIEITAKIHKNVIYTSQNVVIKEYDDHFVYVLDEESIPIKKKVILGRQIMEYVIIESGLEEGDLLVIEGQDRLTEGNKVIMKKVEPTLDDSIFKK